MAKHKSETSLMVWLPSEVLQGPLNGLEDRIKNRIESDRDFTGDLTDYKVEIVETCPYEGMLEAKLTRIR